MDSRVELCAQAYPDVHDQSIQCLAQDDPVDHLHPILVLADMCIFYLYAAQVECAGTVNSEYFCHVDPVARSDLECMVYKQ